MNTKTECRVCLKDEGNIPIFGDDGKPDISLEVKIFGNIQLYKEDEYPKVLCKACLGLLENAILFRKSALHAEALLQLRKQQRGLSKQSSIYIVEGNDGEKNTQNEPNPDLSIVKDENIIQDTDNTEYLTEYLDDVWLGEDISNIDTDESIKTANVNKLRTEVPNFDSTQNQYFVSFDNFKEYPKIPHTKNCTEKIMYMPKNKVNKESASNQYLNECNKNLTLQNQQKSIDVVNTVQKKECPVCYKMLLPYYWARHQKLVHGIDIIKCKKTPKKQCSVCKELFLPQDWARHLKANHEMNSQKPISVECPVCMKMIKTHFYSRHKKTHQKLVCEDCGHTCSNTNQLNRHRLIHSNDLPYHCDHCPYKGRNKDLLAIHMITHTRDYRYKCTLCRTACSTKSNLNVHMRKHEKSGDFPCDLCGKSWYSKLELERHVDYKHLGIKRHVCDICGSAFGYRRSLNKHEVQVHKRAKQLGRPKATYLKVQEEEERRKQQADKEQ